MRARYILPRGRRKRASNVYAHELPRGTRRPSHHADPRVGVTLSSARRQRGGLLCRRQRRRRLRRPHDSPSRPAHPLKRGRYAPGALPPSGRHLSRRDRHPRRTAEGRLPRPAVRRHARRSSLYRSAKFSYRRLGKGPNRYPYLPKTSA